MTVVITDLRGSPAPHYFPNLYVTNNYEVKGASPHTIDKVLRAIGMAKCWAETLGRNLDDDLSEGNFLSAADVISIVRFLGFNAAQQTSEYEAALDFAERTPCSRFKTTSSRTSKVDASETATAVELGNRIRWVASYLEWHRFRRFDNRALSEIDSHLNASAETTIADLRIKAPSSSTQWQDDELLEAPDVSVLKRIDEILHPNSSENPFSSEFIRWRNYLAWRLLSDTGARRSEVFSAATDSVLAPKRRFMIRESKTIPRTVVIIAKTADVFDHFFQKYWLNLPEKCEAHRMGALFTDQKGRALTSGKFLNRIFLSVRKLIGPQPWNITPHS